MNKLCSIGMVLFFVMCLSGCLVGPDFSVPAVNLPEKWTESPDCSTKTDGSQAELVRWWQSYDDPLLASLVDRAFAQNFGLKQAQLRILQAREAKKIAISAGIPSMDATFSYLKRHSASPSVTSNLFEEGFDAGWELDLFGRVRRSVEASDAELQSVIETRRDVLVSLGAEVAANYLRLRMYQQQIEILVKSIENQEKALEIAQKRLKAGFVTALDTSAFEAQIAIGKARLASLEQMAKTTIYAISVLLSQEPTALAAELEQPSQIPCLVQAISVGLPSELLRRRPDIRRAEALIHAATARIGVAEADLFPRFFISGSLGISTTNSAPSFDWSDRFWSIGPTVNWNLFQAGSTIANMEIQRLLQEESVLTYRQIVLNALKEVEAALFSLAKEQQREKALEDGVNAAQKTLSLATELYAHGQTDYLSVLDAERSLMSAKDSLAQSRQQLALNYVTLYKAMGGGWAD